MKKLIKIVAVAALVLSSTSLYAQKLGRINMQELYTAMPEAKAMQEQLQAYAKELGEQAEAIQVELNTKYQEYLKLTADKEKPISDVVKASKEKELGTLQQRIEEFQRMADADIQKKQQELAAHITAKAQDAVKAIATEGGYTFVFDTSFPTAAYINEAQVTDLLPAVKNKLGIKETAAN